MNKVIKPQVKEGHYTKKKYTTLERFISFFYQIDTVNKLEISSLLEVGVGNKVVSNFLKNQGVSVTSCDFDASVEPDIVADVRKIPVEDKSFDAIMACQVLEHIPFEDFEGALEELKRIAKRYVIISLPYRASTFEWVIKFPLIRTLFKRNFFDLSLNIPLKFGGFEQSGQHYWEIGRKPYQLRRIKKIFWRHFDLIESFSPVLNKYHRFFILKIR